MKAALSFLLSALSSGRFTASHRTRPGPSVRPVIILSDAAYKPDRSAGPHGKGNMAYIVAVPRHEHRSHRPTDDYDFFYASAPASQQLLAFSAKLRLKKSFICMLEQMALAAPYMQPQMARPTDFHLPAVYWYSSSCFFYFSPAVYSYRFVLSIYWRFCPRTQAVSRLCLWCVCVRARARP